MDDQSYHRWLEQIAAYQDGSLGEEEFERFDQALQMDEQKRAIFISVHEQTIGVMEVLRARSVASEESSVVESRLFPRAPLYPGRSTLVLASGVVLSLLVGVVWWAVPGKSFGQVAEVTYEKQAVWQTASSDKSIRDLTYLQPATNYMLRSGITRIKMSDGAVVSMTGPAAFTLVSGHELQLDSGKMAVRLPDEQSALTVQVSDLELRDLGTSFGVTAAPEGRVDVAVFDGKVSVTKRSESPRLSERIFVEGEAFSASAEDSVRNKTLFEPERYQDIWPLTVGINELSNVIDFVVPGAKNPLGDLTDDHKLFLIPEQLNCRLDRPVELSLIRPGQTWPQASVSRVRLPSRESIRSYLLVYQPQSSRFGKRVSLSGSVEFERPILGVAATRSQLESTDQPFGLDAIDYGKLAYRYLEERDSERGELPADTISIDASGHRLFFHLNVGAGKDHLRVLVQGD